MENGGTKKTVWQQITPGNIITLAVIAVAIITSYTRSEDHRTDENMHVDESKYRLLTVDEYNDLIRFANTFENMQPSIENSRIRSRNIEKELAVHEVEYERLLSEHEGLESKVSRVHKELLDEINYLKVKGTDD